MRRSHIALLAAALATLAAGCAPREDFEYIDASEIPPGPGIFTGESGEFELLSVDRGGHVSVGDGFSEDSGEAAAPGGEDEGAGEKKIPEGLPPDKRRR